MVMKMDMISLFLQTFGPRVLLAMQMACEFNFEWGVVTIVIQENKKSIYKCTFRVKVGWVESVLQERKRKAIKASRWLWWVVQLKEKGERWWGMNGVVVTVFHIYQSVV